jgi:hypothetical protein
MINRVNLADFVEGGESAETKNEGYPDGMCAASNFLFWGNDIGTIC